MQQLMRWTLSIILPKAEEVDTAAEQNRTGKENTIYHENVSIQS